ncbi:hypothetical protein HF086_008469, partial [Spodoptera exigua]
MMEVDSVHSTIEQYIKPPIFAPSDYITRIRQARPQKPYDVKSIHYDFFLNFEEMESNLKSIRPGKKKGDPVVVDIRGLKYLSDGSVFYRLRHVDEWSVLPQRRNNQRNGLVSPNRLYRSPLKITESKFKHLQELKMFYPEGLREQIHWLNTTYDVKEIVITENGVPTLEDGLVDIVRLDYYKEYLEQVLLAINDGINVTGYTAWTLMDNFEWLGGY